MFIHYIPGVTQIRRKLVLHIIPSKLSSVFNGTTKTFVLRQKQRICFVRNINCRKSSKNLTTSPRINFSCYLSDEKIAQNSRLNSCCEEIKWTCKKGDRAIKKMWPSYWKKCEMTFNGIDGSELIWTILSLEIQRAKNHFTVIIITIRSGNLLI